MKNILATVLFIMLTAVMVNAQQVIKMENIPGNLDQQFEYAFNKAKSNGDFWIGYSIQWNNKQGIMYGTFLFNDESNEIGLRDLLKDSQKYKNYLSGNLSAVKKRNRHVTVHFGHTMSFRNSNADNETALLFRYDKNAKSLNDFKEIDICSLSFYVELYGYPLVWLGKKENKSSLDFLLPKYKNEGTLKLKQDVTAGISVHTDRPEVTSFLKNLVNSYENTDLREDAVFWLGVQDNNEAFVILKNLIYNDSNSDIRKSAVMALGFLTIPETTDELIYIVRHNEERELRQHAVYALGSRAVKKAEEALKDFIENDPDIEIKKRAVYALANNDGNISYLIKIAKTNPSLPIRKAAIYSLSNSDDERAFNALIEMAKN